MGRKRLEEVVEEAEEIIEEEKKEATLKLTSDLEEIRLINENI